MARRPKKSRMFKRAEYGAMLEQTVRLGDVLPPEHLARFVVDAVAQLDGPGALPTPWRLRLQVSAVE